MKLFYEDLKPIVQQIREDGFAALAGETLAFCPEPPDATDGTEILTCEAADGALTHHEITGAMDLPPGRWWQIPADSAQSLVQIVS